MKTVLIFLSLLATYGGPELEPNDINCIATAVYHEARGEPEKGQFAVAHVVLNRVKSDKHPNTACEVVYEPYQFTDIDKANPKAGLHWDKAVYVAILSSTGLRGDRTKGATMYHNPITAPSPRWDFSQLAYVDDIYNHRFYREK